MNQKDVELLLKDLCARLPYGVIVRIGDDDAKAPLTEIVDVIGKNYKSEDAVNGWSIDKIGIKPYLRPMSSMTDKEKEEINELVESESSFLSPIPSWYVYEGNVQKYVDFCMSHHLDWRGLIPKGLALEAPADMYNN